MNTTDPFYLQRFLGAQESYYEQALEEIKDGSKDGHWIWFIFPQVRGLGQSQMSEYYGIGSLDEARAYLNDPVLKSRLIEISTQKALSFANPNLRNRFSDTLMPSKSAHV